MMRAIWDEIKDAEAQAETVRDKAKEEARVLLAKAENDARDLRARGEEEAGTRAQKLVDERLSAAEKAAEAKAVEEGQKTDKIIAAAKGRMPEAAALIKERMIG